MAGRLLFFWDGNLSGAMFKFRGCVITEIHSCEFKSCNHPMPPKNQSSSLKKKREKVVVFFGCGYMNQLSTFVSLWESPGPPETTGRSTGTTLLPAGRSWRDGNPSNTSTLPETNSKRPSKIGPNCPNRKDRLPIIDLFYLSFRKGRCFKSSSWNIS